MAIEIIIGILAGLFVIAIGSALGLLRQHRKQAQLARERALSEQTDVARRDSPGGQTLSGEPSPGKGRITGQAVRLRRGPLDPDLQRNLA